ncbi:MAG: O-antigen ligase family protein [Candidatus Aminicenantes bacterium]|nr:O-antigen ligase family protein [Candidatus Aminicenantes bacterium]
MPIITILIWLMVWGGMYSDISAFRAERLLEGPMDFALALRPLMPLLAVVGCLLVLVKSGRIALSFTRGPILAISAYGLIGMFFFFLSPEPFISLYWGALFLSAVFAAWALVNQEEPEHQVRILMAVNVALVAVLVLFYFSGPLWPILMGAPNPRLYSLPFGLGVQTANGVGRFAGVLALIALSRLRHRELYLRVPWAVLLTVSLVSLALSQSRTAILGFVAGSLLIVLVSRKYSWLVLGIPGIFYLLYNAWFVWRFKGSFETAFFLTGRETTWRRVLAISLRSPLTGHGFHADRLMVEGEHVHMAYLHSLIQSGVLGALLFGAAMFGLWWLLVRNRVLQRLASIEGPPGFLMTESVALVGFMTARSFFESTAAFYGVDLLLLMPAMAYIQVWSRRNPLP